MKPKLVRVKWLDAYADPSWMTRKRARKQKPHPVDSIGWLICETKTHVTIAMDRSGNQFAQVGVIPKAMLKSVKRVRV